MAFAGGPDSEESVWVRSSIQPTTQYSFLENSMDGGAWRTTVHGAAKSQTRPTNTEDADLQFENGKCSLISSALPGHPLLHFLSSVWNAPPGEKEGVLTGGYIREERQSKDGAGGNSVVHISLSAPWTGLELL